MPMSPEDAKRAGDAIQAKTKGAPCPMCRGTKFSIAGYSYVHAKSDPADYAVSGEVIGTVATVCHECGFVSEYARDPLGL